MLYTHLDAYSAINQARRTLSTNASVRTFAAVLAAFALASILLFAACSAEPDPTGGDTGGSDTVTPPDGDSDSTSEVTIALQDGSLARYLVREQFANVDLPNDAIGETTDVSGAIVFNEDGSVAPEQSRIVISAAGLKSDETRRDQFLSREAIQTGQYPEVVFAPVSVSGLNWPLPSSGSATFQIEGDLTVRNVTMPATWDAEAQFDGSAITGVAKTSFTFGYFEMEVPVLFFLLSVDDEIRLEMEFTASVG